MKKEYLNCKNDLYSRINQYKTDNNIKKLELTTKDPHVQELIDAFATVEAAFLYEFNNLGNSIYKTLLVNMGFQVFLPNKILCCGKSDSSAIAEEGSLVVANSCYWRVKYRAPIANYTIETCEIVDHDGLFLNIILNIIPGGEPAKTIGFILDEYLINSIFPMGTNIKAKVWNREYYSTECDCKWHIPQDATMEDYNQFPEQFHQIRIENLDTRALTSQFVISIPLSTKKFITTNNIFINPILMENLYTYQVSMDVPTAGDYQLDLPSQNLVKTQAVSIDLETRVDNIVIDPEGWYSLPNNSLHFQKGYEKPLQIQCLVADKYIEFGDYPLSFQDYNGVSLGKMVYYAKQKILYESDHVKYIIQKLNQYDLLSFFKYYLNNYDLDITLKNLREKIVPLIEMNYVANRVVTEIHCNSSESLIKIMIFYRAIKEKFPIELYVSTKFGVIEISD